MLFLISQIYSLVFIPLSYNIKIEHSNLLFSHEILTCVNLIHDSEYVREKNTRCSDTGKTGGVFEFKATLQEHVNKQIPANYPFKGKEIYSGHLDLLICFITL